MSNGKISLEKTFHSITQIGTRIIFLKYLYQLKNSRPEDKDLPIKHVILKYVTMKDDKNSWNIFPII
jgi:hypothetical protein